MGLKLGVWTVVLGCLAGIGALAIQEFAPDTPAPETPKPETFVEQLRAMEANKAAVRKCRNANTVAAMADCSNLLVADADLEGCLSSEPDAICNAPPVCSDMKAASASGVPLCVKLDRGPRSSAVLVPYTEVTKSAAGFVAEPVKLMQVSHAQKKVVDNCRIDNEHDSLKMSNCISLAVMTDSQRMQFECANKTNRDILEIALSCLDKAMKMPELSDAEKGVLRCAMARGDSKRALECIGDLGLVPVATLKLPRDDLEEAVECVFEHRSAEPLGACLAGLTQPKQTRAIGRCGARVAVARGLTQDDILKCYEAAGLKPGEVAQLRAGMLVSAACADNIATLGAEGVVKCVGTDKDVTAAKQSIDCLKGKSASEAPECYSRDYADLRRCYENYRGDPAGLAVNCSGTVLTDPLAKALVGCSAGMTFRPDANYVDILGGCSSALADAEGLVRKVQNAKKEVDAAVAKVKAAQGTLAKCKAEFDKKKEHSSHDRFVFGRCVTAGQPLPAEVVCAMKAGNQRDAAGLLENCGQELGKRFGKGMQVAVQAYGCYAKHRDNVNASLACAAAPHLSGKAVQQLACANNANSAQVALCLAGPKLPGKTGELLACSSNAKSTSDGLGCAAKVAFPEVFKGMNKEWQAVAECAATTGGEPNSMATCVGTRLLINEIAQCLDRGVGRSGCFGPNNEIVKFWKNYWRAILHPGIGPNNELRRFGRALDQEVLQPTEDLVTGFVKATGALGQAAIDAGRKAIKKIGDALGL